MARPSATVLTAIRFGGYRADIRSLLAVSDIVLFPSAEEMLPVFLLESSGTGVPIVCSDLPGNRDVVTGVIVGDNASAVVGLLNDVELRQDNGAVGRQIAADRFDTEKVGSDLLELYGQLLRANR